jgi:hypothetical protein
LPHTSAKQWAPLCDGPYGGSLVLWPGLPCRLLGLPVLLDIERNKGRTTTRVLITVAVFA